MIYALLLLLFLMISVVGLPFGIHYLISYARHTKFNSREVITSIRYALVILLILALFWVIVPSNIGDHGRTDYSNGSANHNNHWIGSWSASSQPPYPFGISHHGFKNKTLRMIIHPHLNGRALRLRFSNTFGTKPLFLAKVHVAVSDEHANIRPSTDRTVTFGGRKSTTIPIGEKTVSDEVPLHVKAGENLTVSVYVPVQSGPTTWHSHSNQTSYIASGDHAAEADSISFERQKNAWFWLDGLDVVAKPSKKGAVVVVGDSITDGTQSLLNTNQRWPDYLADRFQQGPARKRMSVLNEGLFGNRIFMDGPLAGHSLLHRLHRDVFEQTGVTDVILLEGIDDIRNYPAYDADKMIHGMKRIIERSHAKGLRIIGGTLTPYKGDRLFTAKGERVRETVNHWIRSSDAFDGYIDFDKKLRDPHHPHRMLKKFDSGDHLHPNDAGYWAMANAVDLSMFGINNAGDISSIVKNYKQVGAFHSHRAVRALHRQLKTVGLFEEKNDDSKVIQHLVSLKTLLHRQKREGLISEQAYRTLTKDTADLIDKTRQGHASKNTRK